MTFFWTNIISTVVVLAIIMIVFLYLYYRKSVEFPTDKPSEIRFEESGIPSWMASFYLGLPPGPLDVIVTKDEIWIRLNPLYNNVFFAPMRFLERRIRLETIRLIDEEKKWFGRALTLRYMSERGIAQSPTLFLRDPDGFLRSLEILPPSPPPAPNSR